MFTLTKIILFITYFITSIQSQGCSTIIRRPEIRELNSDQLSRFINAFIKLNSTSDNFYRTISKIHYDSAPVAHGVPAFFPWHREYLKRFQDALWQIDPTVILPYWDWTIDSQSPERSIVFNSEHFGGNGLNGNGCIPNSAFVNFNAFVPNTHCLTRNFNRGNVISAFYSPEAIEATFLQNRNYDSFRETIEGGPHGNVHIGIGGNSGDMSYMYSSNDPLFYLHHTFIDLLWYEWQQRYPSLANTYNGDSASPSDIMAPFGVPVSAVFNTQASGYCYTYSRWSANSQTVGDVSGATDGVTDPTDSTESTGSTGGTDTGSTDNTGLTNLFGGFFGQGNTQPSSTSTTSNFGGLFTGTNTPPTNLFGFSRRASLPESSSDALQNEINTMVKSNFANIQQNTVRSTDRSIKGKIRSPDPLPDDYISRNKLNAAKIRANEKKLNLVIKILNSLKSYRPVADLH